MLVSWETSGEREIVGYDVLRERADGGQTVQVNPVWIPALGDHEQTTSYHYLDTTAEPGIPYRYRLRGVTVNGLPTHTPPVSIQRPAQR